MKKTYLDDMKTDITPADPVVIPKDSKEVKIKKLIVVLIAVAIYVSAVMVLIFAPGGWKLGALIFMLVYAFLLLKPFLKLLRKLFNIPQRSGDV